MLTKQKETMNNNSKNLEDILQHLLHQPDYEVVSEITKKRFEVQSERVKLRHVKKFERLTSRISTRNTNYLKSRHTDSMIKTVITISKTPLTEAQLSLLNNFNISLPPLNPIEVIPAVELNLPALP